MKVYLWSDQRERAYPRALIERGECDREQCRQFSVSISNGEIGLTVRFESEGEFREFMERGETAVQSVQISPQCRREEIHEVQLYQHDRGTKGAEAVGD